MADLNCAGKSRDSNSANSRALWALSSPIGAKPCLIGPFGALIDGTESLNDTRESGYGICHAAILHYIRKINYIDRGHS